MVEKIGVAGLLADHEVVVVGGGAAGLSAALVLGRARRRVVVVDAGAPRNAPARHMHGFISRDGMPPQELLSLGRSELSRYGVTVVEGEVSRIDSGFSVWLATGEELRSRIVLMATGATDGLPDFPGVRERWGRDLLHCPYCHGWEVRDQPIGVLGTHPASVDHALLVKQWSSDVIFFAHSQDLSDANRESLEARDVRVIEGEVAHIVVDNDRLTGVALTDGREVGRTAVFVRTVNRPNAANLLSDLGCELADGGFVTVDGMGRTSVEGVWAAGNVVDPRAQVITCAGAGSAAAIGVNAHLVQVDLEHARSRRPSSRPFQNDIKESARN